MSLKPEVEAVLMQAGWDPDRDRSTEVTAWLGQLGEAFPIVRTALDVLGRFGGLDVELIGPGEEWSRQSFRIDPTLALGEDDRFTDFSEMLGVRLFPLGEVGNQALLALGEDGKVYALMLDLWWVGDSIDEAIERLVRGLSGRLLIDEIAYRAWIEQQDSLL
jgi:hypothetical protein